MINVKHEIRSDVLYNKLDKSLTADTNITYEIIHDEIARAKNKCMPSKIVKFNKYKHKKVFMDNPRFTKIYPISR